MIWRGWTSEAVEILTVGVAEGLSAGQIAARLGCTRNAAIGKALRMGLTLGGGRASQPKAIKPLPPPSFWTDEKIAGLRRGAREGLTVNQIAVQIGSSYAAVSQKAVRLGLTLGRERAPPLKGASSKTKGAVANAVSRSAMLKAEATPLALQAVSTTARPWLTRQFGECAWPAGGEGADTLSCCAPTGGDTYCPVHRARMYAPAFGRFDPKRLARTALSAARAA